MLQEQIEDLKEASKEYEQRQAEKNGENTEEFLNRPVVMNHDRRQS